LVTLGNRLPANIKFVGQNPLDTEKYEDKAWVNTWLNDGPLKGKFPKSWLIEKGEEAKLTDQVELPAVLKPVRGRGSHGVTVAKTREELIAKATALWQEGETILVEVRVLDDILRSGEVSKSNIRTGVLS
jgi:D-alanine-D-alanine ligase